jgi:hypothetical protein
VIHVQAQPRRTTRSFGLCELAPRASDDFGEFGGRGFLDLFEYNDYRKFALPKMRGRGQLPRNSAEVCSQAGRRGLNAGVARFARGEETK